MRSFKGTTLILPGGMLVIPIAIASAVADPPKIDRAVQVEGEFHAIRQVEVDAVTEEPIDFDKIVRGWSDGDGSFLAIDAAEMAKAREDAKLESVEIEEFVPADRLDPTMVKGSYYLMPQRKFPQVTKAMKMLVEAMRLEKKVGVAKVCLRDRQSRCLIAPRDGLLMLYTLAWEEQRKEPDADVTAHTDEKLTKAELGMARELVRTMSTDGAHFAAMRDDLVVAVEKLSETGVRGAVASGVTTQQVAKAADIMDALEASLAALKKPTGRRAKVKA